MCIRDSFRSFKGAKQSAGLNVKVSSELLNIKLATGNVDVKLFANKDVKVLITDNAYGSPEKMIALKKGKNIKSIIETQKSGGWYDFTISIVGDNLFAQRYACLLYTSRCV